MRIKQTFEIEYESPYNNEEDGKNWLCAANLQDALTLHVDGGRPWVVRTIDPKSFKKTAKTRYLPEKIEWLCTWCRNTIFEFEPEEEGGIVVCPECGEEMSPLK